MTPDTTRKTSFKPTSRRSSHLRTDQRPARSHPARDRANRDPQSIYPGGAGFRHPQELYCGPPKSRASVRTIALDEDGTSRLVDHAVKQAVELLKHQFTEQRYPDSRVRTGPGWREGRAKFTSADGRPVRPEYLTHRSTPWSENSTCRPSGCTTCATAPPPSPWPRTDLKVIQQMLGLDQPGRRRVGGVPGSARDPRRLCPRVLSADESLMWRFAPEGRGCRQRRVTT